MKLSLLPKRAAWLAGLIILLTNLLMPEAASAQLSQPGITKNCDIPSFQYVHSAYDDCGPLLAAARSCLTTTVVGTGNEQITYNFLVSHGLSPIQAAGVMGNLAVEGSFHPTIEERSGGGGYGIAQWTGGRRTAIEAAASAAGVDIKADTQENLVFQLNYLFKEANARGDWQGQLQQTDIQSATFYWEDHFERPAVRHQMARVGLANGFLAKYGNGAAPAAPVSSGCTDSDATSTNVVAAPNCPANGIVYSDQYTEQQLHAIFGPPVRQTEANLVYVNFLGHSVQVNKVVAPCLVAVSQELISNGITYQPQADKGGFFCKRDNDGQIGDRSYHIYGAACDFNPNTNNYYSNAAGVPYDPSCPISGGVINTARCYDMPPQVVSAFQHHGFAWGGNFSHIKDYMHFEWHGVLPP